MLLPHPQVDNMIVEPVTSFPVRRLSAPIPGVRAFQSGYEEAVPIFLWTVLENW
jgi:hypothetical protein